MGTNLPAARWALQYYEHVYTDKLWAQAKDAIMADALDRIPRGTIETAAHILGVEFDDAVHAMWRKAKREGMRLRRVTVK